MSATRPFKTCLAPMVRCGTLPLRLMALKYGADYVYSPEIIAIKLARCKRVENKVLGSVDFVTIKSNELVLRTIKADRPCIVQLGASNAEIAVQATRVIQHDFFGVDLNMGCPKHFSVSGGMGAALLTNPDAATDILQQLIANFPHLQISCKIRLLHSTEATIDLMQKLAATGVRNIAVHCRERHERPRDSAHWPELKTILEQCKFNTPIYVNGDVFKHTDLPAAHQATGCDGIMIARGALRNVSLFAENPLPCRDIWIEYIKLAIQYDMHPSNLKYTLNRMMGSAPTSEKDSDICTQLTRTKSHDDVCALFGLNDFLQQVRDEREAKKQALLAAGLPLIVECAVPSAECWGDEPPNTGAPAGTPASSAPSTDDTTTTTTTTTTSTTTTTTTTSSSTIDVVKPDSESPSSLEQAPKKIKLTE